MIANLYMLRRCVYSRGYFVRERFMMAQVYVNNTNYVPNI